MWTPRHTKAKIFLTWIGHTLDLLAAGECGWVVDYVTRRICQEEINGGKDSQTQGGKLNIYADKRLGDTASREGRLSATLKVDPNACSKKIKCPETPTNDAPPPAPAV